MIPAKITITQCGLAPRIVIVDGAINAPPGGLPPYPLNSDPSQTWYLTWSNGTLLWVQENTNAPLTVSAPGSAVAGVAMAVTGTVTPPGDSVVFGLSDSNSVAPGLGLVAATNVAGALAGSLTPAAAGTFYVWAIDTTTGLTAVSGPVSVSANSVALSVDAMGTATYAHADGGTIKVTGSVTPAQQVSLRAALSESDITPPASWTTPTLEPGGGAWSAMLPMPGAAGTYYVWVETIDDMGVAVSAFTISVT